MLCIRLLRSNKWLAMVVALATVFAVVCVLQSTPESMVAAVRESKSLNPLHANVEVVAAIAQSRLPVLEDTALTEIPVKSSNIEVACPQASCSFDELLFLNGHSAVVEQRLRARINSALDNNIEVPIEDWQLLRSAMKLRSGLGEYTALLEGIANSYAMKSTLMVEHSNYLFSSFKSVDSEILLLQAASLFPRDPQVLAAYGDKLLSEGRNYEAVTLFRRQYQIEPSTELGEKISNAERAALGLVVIDGQR